MKQLINFAILAALASVAYYFAYLLPEQERKKTAFSLQEKCTKQAEQFYIQNKNETSMDFINHYNDKLNKCFVVLVYLDNQTSSRITFASRMLFDAFEGYQYANFMYSWEFGKEGTAKPCDVTLPSGENATCHSREEFDSLINKYYMQ